RMGSTRLPGKTLAEIEGKPLLAHIIERVSASKTIDQIAIATTMADQDQPILELATHRGFGTYRGSTDDVLDRYYQSAKMFAADIIVRITPDDPFKDSEIIDAMVERAILDERLDYVSNTMKPTYPEGLDVEVFRFEALERAWRGARRQSEREHVTPYIWNRPGEFQVLNVTNDTNLSHLRWTIDYPEDLEFARQIYCRLYRGQVFHM